MYLVKTPAIIQNLFPGFVWRKPTSDKVLYLTFDDGPIPVITPWVLQQLEKYKAKATFFCVGDNVRKYPEVFSSVKDAGHTVGNHTFNHLSGWNTETSPYLDNVEACAELIESNLFRPPYGRIKPSQANALQKEYEIVMWDVLSGDFDEKITGAECLRNVKNGVKNGSVIVFHDSQKAFPRLQYVLPRVLEHYAKAGFTFKAIKTKKNLAKLKKRA